MTSRNEAEIISIGTELLMGELVDTDAKYLAEQLRLLGIELGRITTIGDDREQLTQAFQRALERSRLIITSGGLGPTEDDLTRECLAAALGEEPAVDAELEKQLRAFFSRYGREMPASNIKQAMLIPSAEALPNPRGTAPGWWVEKGENRVAALPGPPEELQQMWQNEVKPRLLARFPGRAILTRTIKTFGLPEARVAEMVAPFFDATNPSLGIYAKSDGIHLRLIARGENAESVLQTAEKQLEEILTHHMWGRDGDSLEEIICGLLKDSSLTLATMEDGSRGLLSGAISSAGNFDLYRGGFAVYSDEAKAAWGVSPGLIQQYGAISGEVAQAMAVAAREQFSADFGLSTTGIAGLDSTAEKQMDLAYIGLADARGAVSWQQSYLANRKDARHRLAIAALFRLRRRLIEADS